MTARIYRPLAIAATAVMLTTLLGTSPVSSLEQDSLPTADKGTVLKPAPNPEPITAPETGPILAPLEPKSGSGRPSGPDPTFPTHNAEPTFQVKAIGFTAIDETGIDYSGSDEIFVTWRTNEAYVSTYVYDDVDSGDFRSFHALQSCILPIQGPGMLNGRDGVGWECRDEGVPGPIEFQVVIYEDDGIRFPMCFDTGIGPDPGCVDDMIGHYTGSWTAAELSEMLDAPGDHQSFSVRVLPCSANTVCNTGLWDGDYDFHFRITRMEDNLTPIKLKMVD